MGLVQITPLDFPVSFPPPHRGLSFPRGVHIDIAGRGAGNFGLLFLFLLIERDSQPFVFDVFLRAVSKRRKLTVSPPQSVWPFYSRESVAIPRCPCPSCPCQCPRGCWDTGQRLVSRVHRDSYLMAYFVVALPFDGGVSLRLSRGDTLDTQLSPLRRAVLGASPVACSLMF